MPLNPDDRSTLILSILDMGLEFMAASFLDDKNDFGLMADQMVKGLMATGAMMGFFKEPELAKIYRDNSIQPPTKKGIMLVRQFCKGMVEDPEFHAKNGEWVDAKLQEIWNRLGSGFHQTEAQVESTA